MTSAYNLAALYEVLWNNSYNVYEMKEPGYTSCSLVMNHWGDLPMESIEHKLLLKILEGYLDTIVLNLIVKSSKFGEWAEAGSVLKAMESENIPNRYEENKPLYSSLCLLELALEEIQQPNEKVKKDKNYDECSAIKAMPKVIAQKLFDRVSKMANDESV